MAQRPGPARLRSSCRCSKWTACASGELARRAKLGKQTITTMVRLLERDGLVPPRARPRRRTGFRIVLTAKARRFEPVAERTLEELASLAQQSLGERRLQTVKHGLKEWIET